MNKPIIEVKNLSKLYRLGVIGSTTLYESVNRWWYKISGKEEMLQKIGENHRMIEPNDPQAGPEPNTMWALKDVSFTVNKGEIVGIIGKNGSGKSTLLKLLTRITEPTSGEAIILGRVASLLEVGTGFHQELTGRENIYLNGAILGMKKKEINEKFDDIVNFSGVEKFIDTPVKRYSSGMYVRLAFAVAAHLEPEILLVDEVLAVGDMEFQKKCLGKMQTIAEGGRTVLFVSHNIDSVRRLCQRAILLNNGSIQYVGSTDNAINFYLKSNTMFVTKRRWNDISKAPCDDIVRLTQVRVHTEDDKTVDNFDITKPIGITMDYEVLQDGYVFTHECNLFNEQEINILNSHDVASEFRKVPHSKGYYSSTVWIPSNFLSEGIVIVGVAIFNPDLFRIHIHELNVIAFNVVDNITGESARGNYVGEFPGIVRPILKWNTIKK